MWSDSDTERTPPLEFRWRSPGSSPDFDSLSGNRSETARRCVRITDIWSASEEDDGNDREQDSATSLVERTATETASDVSQPENNVSETRSDVMSVVSHGQVRGYYRDLSLCDGFTPPPCGPRRPMCEVNRVSPIATSTGQSPIYHNQCMETPLGCQRRAFGGLEMLARMDITRCLIAPVFFLVSRSM